MPNMSDMSNIDDAADGDKEEDEEADENEDTGDRGAGVRNEEEEEEEDEDEDEDNMPECAVVDLDPVRESTSTVVDRIVFIRSLVSTPQREGSHLSPRYSLSGEDVELLTADETSSSVLERIEAAKTEAAGLDTT